MTHVQPTVLQLYPIVSNYVQLPLALSIHILLKVNRAGRRSSLSTFGFLQRKDVSISFLLFPYIIALHWHLPSSHYLAVLSIHILLKVNRAGRHSSSSTTLAQGSPFARKRAELCPCARATRNNVEFLCIVCEWNGCCWKVDGVIL